MIAVRPRRDVGLEYLSVFGMPLPSYVELASRLGCDFVSVNWRGVANAQDAASPHSLQTCKSVREQFAAAFSDCSIRLELVEGFAITPDTSVASLSKDLDAIARLGAQSICVVSLDKDIARTNAEFALLAELAGQRELTVTSEVGAGVLWNIHTATASWNEVAHSNYKLLIDAMHFFRRAGTVKDLKAVPPNAIAHIQLCDVPMPAVIDSYMEEALFERRCPGDGDLPLEDLLAATTETVPVGLEVPIRSTAHKMEEVLRQCVVQTRKLTVLAAQP